MSKLRETKKKALSERKTLAEPTLETKKSWNINDRVFMERSDDRIEEDWYIEKFDVGMGKFIVRKIGFDIPKSASVQALKNCERRALLNGMTLSTATFDPETLKCRFLSLKELPPALRLSRGDPFTMEGRKCKVVDYEENNGVFVLQYVDSGELFTALLKEMDTRKLMKSRDHRLETRDTGIGDREVGHGKISISNDQPHPDDKPIV